MATEQSSRGVGIHAENIGGISETQVEFDPGVTILIGRNATNRTSFLQAIMGVLGSDNVSVKGDAEQARVEMELGGETYTRTFERTGTGVSTGGSPYLENTEVADLFASLLEGNEARRAVARGEDLRELIMRPVDTEAIRAKLKSLQSEQQRIDRELEELSELEEERARLETKQAEVEQNIEETRKELEAKQTEIESTDMDIAERREEKEELEEALSALQDVRSELEEVRQQLDNQRESLEPLEEEKGDLGRELEDLPEVSETEIEDIEAEISRLRSRKQQLDSRINSLQSIIQFNEDIVNGDKTDIVDSLRDETESDAAVTDQLLDDSQNIVCWTCGSEIEQNEIDETLELLREIRQEQFQERNGISQQLEELKSEKQDLEDERRRQQELAERLAEVETEIERRRERVDEYETRHDDLAAEMEEREAEVEEFESEDHGPALELHREADQLEFELNRLEKRREDVLEQIEDIEARLDEQDSLETEREEIETELQDLRTRIDRIEDEAAEAFNEQMEEILDLLDYRNIERIWIERKERQVREGRKKVMKSVFHLHVIREAESGTVYEDTVQHLSESEREVTGLVFCLAGFLVHDVYEDVPFMLLDSLEALDSARIATLVDHFREYADFLVVALLPEDTEALDEGYERVEKI